MTKRDEMRLIRVGDLKLATEYNRDIDDRWVTQLIASFTRTDSIPPLEISDRGAGLLVIVDGQHRSTAVDRKWGPNALVWCHVHFGLTLAEEAQLFYDLNQRRNLRAYSAFHALVQGRDPEALEIVAVLASHGLTYGQGPSAGVVAAIAALREVYARTGAHGLSATLSVVIGAWGHDSHSWDAVLLRGVSLFLDHYREASAERLRDKLARYPGRAVGLMADAKALPFRASEPRRVVWQIVATYNKGARSGQLAPWPL